MPRSESMHFESHHLWVSNISVTKNLQICSYFARCTRRHAAFSKESFKSRVRSFQLLYLQGEETLNSSTNTKSVNKILEGQVQDMKEFIQPQLSPIYYRILTLWWLNSLELSEVVAFTENHAWTFIAEVKTQLWPVGFFFITTLILFKPDTATN